MQISPTMIDEVFIMRTEPHADARGDFARSYCSEEFRAAGIDLDIVQINISRNAKRGTLRGMHFQGEPVPDPKLVRCTRGRIFDVALDLRPDSDTFCHSEYTILSPELQNAIFVPPGCAHGFLTLEDNCEIEYLMGAPYVADLAHGVRWDDPAFDIDWPHAPALMSDRDASYPDFSAEI
ncbi:MAG: dTDP-4-dehydrorhamnose 3,5-epimerase family protein [Rhodospirillaceae bacterium]|nr:dTDP-4-dehydrorhamnose 3,5-epimerase family protein [Rhodospirillaceae bacterium]MBT3809146.1 dTDP-4-dehydrorhamnose 3,5-epimerase family protein [Rhodospirillaceae bacterium]MBT3929407.1 dTDP-4-dehydrorhamnose 3,5-epimerase family protein [Rhodospirillaceae bacterium]MBT4773708.1 dTDP-4-dehydrorhamnose 3,5-epimerase family protein [Rhodospirillaceae bacterium]MBT5357636.1 dTDP-4-dehydrorhamnose 3,5-epimerase family protein [Rhodospirillaceae bacterium]